MIDQLTTERIHGALAAWQPANPVQRIEVIAPDVSLRRYYRVFLSKAPQTVVAMIFDSVQAAEVGGGPIVPADEAVVLATKYFRAQGVRVPELYFDGRVNAILLIEDLGRQPLAGLWGQANCQSAYQQAIDQIACIQRATSDPELFIFQRAFTRQVYLKEMSEFVEFLLPQFARTESIAAAAPAAFAAIAEAIGELPPTLVHRDFHSWNLMLDSQGLLRVIDFQDALLGPPTYDLVSLLHDRDTDAGLGVATYQALVEYAKGRLTGAGNFERAFNLVAAQRDLKVAGRFAKLVSVRGLEQYGRWIPGTTARLVRTLELLQAEPRIAEFYRVLAARNLLDEIRGRYVG